MRITATCRTEAQAARLVELGGICEWVARTQVGGVVRVLRKNKIRFVGSETRRFDKMEVRRPRRSSDYVSECPFLLALMYRGYLGWVGLKVFTNGASLIWSLPELHAFQKQRREMTSMGSSDLSPEFRAEQFEPFLEDVKKAKKLRYARMVKMELYSRICAKDNHHHWPTFRFDPDAVNERRTKASEPYQGLLA